MNKNFPMRAKTLFGLEDVLANELRLMGANNIQKGIRSVSFEGDKGFMYKANLALRTAIKILKPIHCFQVRNEQDLYDKIYALHWAPYLKPTGTMAVDATIHSDCFTHSQYIALKAKDAIVDKFRNETGMRPNVDLRHPDMRLNVHIDRNTCTLSLDSSGESLHKRGYKTAQTLAPINEVLAAGMLLLSGWKGQSNFLDPMCGSGTILAEAAMIACNIPPNLMRKEFAFERWPDWDVDLFETIEEALLNKAKEFHYKIIGYDKDIIAVKKAKENIKNAHLEDFVEISHMDFFGTKKSTQGPLHLVFNPPYGERLSIEDLEKLYGTLGTTLKHGYANSQAWFVTSNLEGLKFVGLRPSVKIKLFNAKLEARFVKYELYEGSKKGSKQSDQSL